MKQSIEDFWKEYEAETFSYDLSPHDKTMFRRAFRSAFMCGAFAMRQLIAMAPITEDDSPEAVRAKFAAVMNRADAEFDKFTEEEGGEG